MANDCYYKMIVRGKKNACYAFMGGQHRYEQDIDYESGTDEDYEIGFSGTCKSSLDYYTENYKGETPVEIPDDPEKAEEEAERNADYNVKSRSAMYNVEVMCSSQDEGNRDESSYEHYKNGKPYASEVPEFLKFSDVTEINNLTYEAGKETIIMEKFEQEKNLATDNGNRFYIKDERLYLNDAFSVSVPKDSEFTVSNEESETALVMAVLIEDDEKVNIKFHFSCDDEERCSKDKSNGHIYIDNDSCTIFALSLSATQNFFEKIINNCTVRIGVNIIINSKSYYITAGARVGYESAVATEFRILEEVLNSMIVGENGEKINVSRISSGFISNFSDSLFSSSQSAGSDDDEE